MMNVGVVLVTHGRIGEELIKATEEIVKEKLPMVSVSVFHTDSIDNYRDQIGQAIEEVDRGSGVLIFSDMFGGTPSNLCLSFLKKGRIELVTGVNLPMLLKLATLSDDLNVSDVVQFILEYGQRNIRCAETVLEHSKT